MGKAVPVKLAQTGMVPVTLRGNRGAAFWVAMDPRGHRAQGVADGGSPAPDSGPCPCFAPKKRTAPPWPGPVPAPPPCGDSSDWKRKEREMLVFPGATLIQHTQNQ